MKSLILDHTQANDTLVIALSKPSGALRATYYTMLALIVAAILWASLSIVDIAVHAVGVVRPLGGVQMVQSAITAHIHTLKVRENAWVNSGDTLAMLDQRFSAQREKLLKEKLHLLLLEIADLRALQRLEEQTPLRLPVYANELRARLKEREIMRQEALVLEAKLKRSEELFAKKFISPEEYEQTRLQRDQKELQLRQWQENCVRTIADRLQQKELQNIELESELRNVALEQEQSVLRAPVAGYVSELHFKTPNVLLKSGEALCSISPKEEQVAEFYIPAKDIGFVQEGLTVRYQLDAFPFQEWGMITGSVVSVAKDYSVNTASTAQIVQFKVTASLSTFEITSARHGKTALLKSGMTYRAHIIVAQKRLITMLWDKTIDFFALA